MAGKTYIKTGSATWERIKKIYIKTGGTTWTAIRKAYIKIGTSTWAKIYDTASNRPYLANSDRPRIRLNSYRTTGYIEAEPVQQMGPPITNPTSGWPSGTVGDYLWGADANNLNNWISGNGSAMTSSYKWYYSPGTDPNGQIEITTATVSSGATDKFQNAQAYLGQYDNKYIWFKPTYTNSAGSTSAISNPVLIVKQLPVRNSSGLSTPTTGAPVDTAWTYTFDVDDAWYDSVDKTASRVEWFLETSNTSPALNGTTRVKTDYLNNIFVQGSGIITGSSSYTPTTAGGAVGKYVYIRLVLVNSNTLYQYPSTGYIAHEMVRGPITGAATVDIFPTLSKLDTYLTIPATGLYTGTTTDGTAYTQCRLRGNTGSYTPNPAEIFWKYEYASSTSGPWSTFYDSGGNYTSATSYDTLENQNHDYYVEDAFYTTSAGVIPGNTSNQVVSAGKYLKFTATANPNGTPTTNSVTVGPILDYTTAPGTPTLTWNSTFDANNSYITAYWSAATKIGRYYLQYNTGSSWVSLGSGTTSTPTVNSPAGPYLVPHGTRLFRVINQNTETVYAKSASVSFDSTPPPGNVTNIKNYNFTASGAMQSQLFLTTGTSTTSVNYSFISNNIDGLSIGPFSQTTISSYPYRFDNNLSPYFTNRGSYSSITTYGPGDYVLYGGVYYFCRFALTTGILPTNTSYWTNIASFTAYVTPFNNLKAGSATTSSTTLLINPGTTYDPTPSITSGPTFDLISQTSFRTNYTPNTYATNVTIDVKVSSVSITGYPKSVNPTANANNTDSVSGRSSGTLHYVYITPRYLYSATPNVEYTGSQVSNTVTTLTPAPSPFTYSISQGGSVSAPSTPTLTRVSSTSNTLLVDTGYTSMPAGVYNIGINQYGAAITNGTPAQYVISGQFNGFDTAGNFVGYGSGTIDTLTGILTSASFSDAYISATSFGTTRAAVASVSTTSGALSWQIGYTISGASAGNGSYTYSTTSMPVTIYTSSTETSNPTVSITSVTAYSNSDYTGSTTAGTAGSPTSSVINRPSATSSTTTIQYFTYYTAPTYSVTWQGNGGTPTTQTTGPLAAGSAHTVPSVSRSGYTLNGWYDASTGGNLIVSSTASTYTPTASTTLYAQWTAFVAPTCIAPSLQFQRTASAIRWYCDYPTPSGNYSSIIGMQFQIDTGSTGAGTRLADRIRTYPGDFTYPYSAASTIWAFRCGSDSYTASQTTDGIAGQDVAYSASARYARARVVMLGTNGTTYYGTWSSPWL